MARLPRRILPDHLYEVTLTTYQGRFFFIPSERLNELVVGALAYAQKKYGLEICYVAFMSNHAHLLVVPDSAKQLSDFLCLAKSQIAKEVQRLCGWTGGIFEANSAITMVSDEPGAQIRRLGYLMSQGMKEGLVPEPEKWPGVQCVRAVTTGTMKLEGVWVRRSELYECHRAHDRRRGAARRRRRKKPSQKKFEDRISLVLSPPPCWADLEPAEIVRRTRELRQQLLEEYAAVRATVTKGYLERIMDRSKFCFRPAERKKSDRPKVHAETMEEWIRWVKNWESWLDLYKRASARLRQGIVEAISEFPEHAFVPTGILFREHAGLPPPATAG